MIWKLVIPGYWLRFAIYNHFIKQTFSYSLNSWAFLIFLLRNEMLCWIFQKEIGHICPLKSLLRIRNSGIAQIIAIRRGLHSVAFSVFFISSIVFMKLFDVRRIIIIDSFWKIMAWIYPFICKLYWSHSGNSPHHL